MSTDSAVIGYRVDSQTFALWRPLLVYAVFGSAFAGLLHLGVGLTPWEFLAGWILVSAIPILLTFPVWLWRSWRTSYEVTKGNLIVTRRRRTVLAAKCSEVHRLEMDGAATWMDLLIPFSVPGGIFPRLVIITDRRLELPPIVVWGNREPAKIERELKAAMANQGARG